MEDESSASSYMILLDHSQYMLNDDYEPTRFEFQQNAAINLVDCIIDDEIKKSKLPPKMGVMTGTDVLTGPCEDTEVVYEALVDNLALSTTDLTTSIRVASLALRKDEKDNTTNQKLHRKVIYVFVGSPLNNDDNNLAHVGRMLKSSRTDIVLIGLGNDTDRKKLQELASIANGQVVYLSPSVSIQDSIAGLFENGLSSIDKEGNAGNEVEEEKRTTMIAAEAGAKSETDPNERIDQLLTRSQQERRKIELMLQTSFSADSITPSPPTRNRVQRNGFSIGEVAIEQVDISDVDDDGSNLPTPSSSSSMDEDTVEEEVSSPLEDALDCGPEISMQQPMATPPASCIAAATTTRDEESRHKEEFTNAVKDYENAVVQLERHLPTSPVSSYNTELQLQENNARYANLQENHVPAAEYERVKKELRAAKRYIRVLQRLVHEKDEMISALHDMIGYLRQQVYGPFTGEGFEEEPAKEKSPITSLALDGMSKEINERSVEMNEYGQSPGTEEDLGGVILKTSSSGEESSNVSISDIRRKTRELEAMHADLSSKSNTLQNTSSMVYAEAPTLTKTSMSHHHVASMTEKRNKKRELEALRESIVVTNS